jgi:hypothetical protein
MTPDPAVHDAWPQRQFFEPRLDVGWRTAMTEPAPPTRPRLHCDARGPTASAPLVFDGTIPAHGETADDRFADVGRRVPADTTPPPSSATTSRVHSPGRRRAVLASDLIDMRRNET